MEASLEPGTTVHAGRLVSAAWEGWWYDVDTTRSRPPVEMEGCGGAAVPSDPPGERQLPGRAVAS